MRKITAFIDGSSNTITFGEIIPKGKYRSILIKKATIFWNYFNIPENLQFLTYGRDVINLYAGYYNFTDLAGVLPSNVILTKRKNSGKCEISNRRSESLVFHRNILDILGYSKSTTSLARGSHISQNQVDINNGLRYIRIDCDIVDNIDNFDSNGNNSKTITSLPITTDKEIFGTVSSYVDIESRIDIKQSDFDRISFTVKDQDGKAINVGRILLEVYLV